MRRIQLWLLVLSVAVLSGCPDDGGTLDVCVNPDLSCDDGNACTVDSCDPVIGCINDRISCNDNDACTADSCNTLSGCVNAPITCNDNNACTTDSCDAVAGCMNTDISASCNDNNACTADSCNSVAGCVNATVDCDDGNECTAESCNPVAGCASRSVANGTLCERGRGECIRGTCVLFDCAEDADCEDSNACTADSCNLATNQCINAGISADCDDDDACTADSCDPESGCVNTDSAANCDDGNDCTANSCTPETGCANLPVENGTPCDGGSGACSASVCMSLTTLEYQQDFESLDESDTSALGDDGWLVFGNVFDGVTMDFLYGYGPNPAPNDGAAFSAVATGEGGPEQGNQQLSVYSDYNNADHATGQLIESTVYRERAITTADVGRTIRFHFDAKRGNINDPGNSLCPCSTKATGFIKTINPAAGFATTNLLPLDTTALPADWSGQQISLVIDSGLVGQLLQIGFTTTATLYQPSANFYDNVEVSSGPTVP